MHPAFRKGYQQRQHPAFTGDTWKQAHDIAETAQRDGSPAEYRWRPLLNATNFG